MKNQNNNKEAIWVGSDHLTNESAFNDLAGQEFKETAVEEQMGLEANRRDFLKYLGFGLGAATLAAGCDIPVKKAIPYVIKPDAIVPGVASYYASTFAQGGDYCSILVKTREGRPIKVEGNSLSKVTKGGTSARAQASVLSLYDTSRIQGPLRIAEGKLQRPKGSQETAPTWEEIDAEIGQKLNAGSTVRMVAPTIMSPMTKSAIETFKSAFPNSELVMYDAISSSAMLEANEESFGAAVLPSYHFDKADVIVSFDADFLGTWISPIEFAKQYASNRRIPDVGKAKMSRHIQVESHMSLTGSNADNRIMVKPSQLGAAISTLYNEVAALTGGTKVNGPALPGEQAAKLKKVARELVNSRGAALVVSGSNNKGEQVLINGINNMINSYGNTIDMGTPSYQRQGMDKPVLDLINEMKAGRVNALFVFDGCNPAYDLPDAADFQDGMSKVGLKVSFSGLENETTLLCDYVTPTHHYLESWGDAQPKQGHYSLIQPTIAPLFNTRQTEESLLTWAKSEQLDKEAEQPMMEYLKAQWKAEMFPQQTGFSTFQAFWDSHLHDGVFELEIQGGSSPTFNGNVRQAAGQVRKPNNGEGLEISFYETVNMGGGQYANNPWLQEMPDPVARTTWGNYLAIPVSWDGGNSFQALNNLNKKEIYGNADIVEISAAGGDPLKVTAVRQFGQRPNTVALALGYGREVTGRVGRALGNEVGANAFPWVTRDGNGNVQYYVEDIEVSKAIGEEKAFACVQYHHTMGVTGTDPKTNETINVDERAIMPTVAGYQGALVNRSIIYQDSLEHLDELVHHVEEKRAEAKKLNEGTLYPFDEYNEKYYSQGHHWAMHIDLNACIGCGACQVACVAENNVPVVGKNEVARHHEMTWLRIDRYFYGDYENPNVVYQPMLCQHCDNAPCENVCPVAATNHSSEGLNQMTYNRCIGTRYCANNCPYKVRRFNWLDYTTADLFPLNEEPVAGEEVPFGADNLTRMVLNPDVTVRSRGVIEKCSFCVQRIQEGKLTAKREKRRLRGSDVKTACQTACPTGAIVFGDRNDKEAEVSKRMQHPLSYLVLEETNTQSSVNYQAKVNNRSTELDA